MTAVGMSVALLLVSLLSTLEYVQVNNLQNQNMVLTNSVATLQAENQKLAAQLANNGNGSEELLFQSWISHLDKLQNLDPNAALEDYAPNATIISSGDTQGWGGNYTGSAEIGMHLQYLFGDEKTSGYPYASFSTTSFLFKIESFNSSSPQNESAGIGANLFFAGSSRMWGAFNGTISARCQYEFQNGAWLISQEDWDFLTFSVQNSQA